MLNKSIRKGQYIAIRPNEVIEARFGLTQKQNDIIDIVFNQISDDDNYSYEIPVSKYLEMYEVSKNNVYRDLKKAVDTFHKDSGFFIRDKSLDKEIYVYWFSSIEYDNKNKVITVELSNKLKNVFLEIKKRIYYDIRYTLNFKSVYSKRMYYLLKAYEDIKTRYITLDELKSKLDCVDSYKTYGEFNRKVLKVAMEEINTTNKSDIYITCKEDKTGRKVIGFTFTIETQAKRKNNVEVANTRIPHTKDNSELDILIQQVQDIVPKTSSKNAENILKAYDNDVDKIKKAYIYTQKQSETRTIKSVSSYMISIKDADLESIPLDNSNFNKFEQRKCPFECSNCVKDENVVCKDCELFQKCTNCKHDSDCVMK